MTKVFFLNKLKDGASPEEYEKWVREKDYPIARAAPSVKAYHVHKMEGTLMGGKPYDYLEVIDITDIDSYKKDLDSPATKELLSEWQRYIGETVAIYGDAL